MNFTTVVVGRAQKQTLQFETNSIRYFMIHLYSTLTTTPCASPGRTLKNNRLGRYTESSHISRRARIATRAPFCAAHLYVPCLRETRRLLAQPNVSRDMRMQRRGAHPLLPRVKSVSACGAWLQPPSRRFAIHRAARRVCLPHPAAAAPRSMFCCVRKIAAAGISALYVSYVVPSCTSSFRFLHAPPTCIQSLSGGTYLGY